ncbi:TlpA family protein disulfide reductase [Corynebacterium uropygiale]|uniref:TlpA family protein disulfide reductase n=1 Tax=Corynebacterium uropygiale TaxID=1775911 RepID=A0A9X1QRM5_9CORY|nr:TlpA disulfide reductase family protein [Corynebacterium uropygiale]MCF4005745.1 TlpA family protein disulfide reductase [Corynebacterium uropygiale]
MKPAVRWSILGIIIISVLIALAVPRLLRSPEPSGSEGSTSTSAPSQPARERAEPQSAAAGSRPDCPSVDLGKVQLDCLGGHADAAPARDVTVVNLWAWWCAPCREELPVLDEYARKHPEYAVVGAHVDPQGQAGADFLTETGVSLPSLADPTEQLAITYGLPKAVPITLVFREGKLAGMFPQVFHSVEDLDAAVSSVLA